MNILNNIYYIYANMDKNSKFLLTMIVLIIILLVFILVISLIQQKKDRKKYEEARKNIVKERHINKNVNYDIDEINNTIIKKETITKEKVSVEPVKEEIEIIEEQVDDEIENIKKMIENTLEQEPIRLNKFEEEQEKTAIISYDELVKRAGTKKIVYKKEEKVTEKVVEEPKKEVKSTFKPSQVLSPIYGVQKEKEKIDPVMKSFEEIEDRKFRLTSTPDEEMKNDVEFLNNLKKFRSSLD